MNPSPRPNPNAPNPYAPPRARVRDIAAPKAETVLAERSTRLGASILDMLIFFAMVYVPLLLGTIVAAAGGDSAASGALALVGVVLVLGGFVAWLYMTLKQMSATGQSLAKKFLKIKVVRSDGSPASLSNLIWKRNVLNALLSIIPMYGLIEVLFIFAETRQCLHDKIADTIVVQA
ncbi:MAG: RDD family protein [Cyanobacteria bacterium]|nr:RDD family protein [Cyanobacteriota bacterium]